MKHVKVNYKVKFIGKATPDLTVGEIYECVEEHYENDKLLSISVIDNSEEDYIYDTRAFKRVNEE